MNKRFGFLIMALISLSILSGCSNDEKDAPKSEENEISDEEEKATEKVDVELLIYIENEDGKSVLPYDKEGYNYYFSDAKVIKCDKYDRPKSTQALNGTIIPVPEYDGKIYRLGDMRSDLEINYPKKEFYYKVVDSPDWLNFNLRYNPEVAHHADWYVGDRILPSTVCTATDKGPMGVVKEYNWSLYKYSIVFELTFVRHSDGSHTVKDFN